MFIFGSFILVKYSISNTVRYERIKLLLAVAKQSLLYRMMYAKHAKANEYPRAVDASSST